VKPRLRRQAAAAHVIVALLGGIWATVALAHEPYERVLMGISWYSILITAVDVLQTTDVRVEQTDADPD
jgi:hypothetical protein